MKATQSPRNQTGKRLAAVLLALPLALSTTGCGAAGRLALSLGLHAHTQTTSDSDTPRTTRFAAMPRFEGRPHHRAALPLLVDTMHHQQHTDLRASSMADMQEGVVTDSFTPTSGRSSNN